VAAFGADGEKRFLLRRHLPQIVPDTTMALRGQLMVISEKDITLQ
jgi:hypothetical protein